MEINKFRGDLIDFSAGNVPLPIVQIQILVGSTKLENIVLMKNTLPVLFIRC